MNQTFGKKEKLKSKKLIGHVFVEGCSLTSFPLKLVYLKLTIPKNASEAPITTPLQVGVTVPKKKFRKASERIHLKRLMREAYRKNKYLVYDKDPTSYAFMFLYLGKEKADYHKIAAAMQHLLKRFVDKEIK